jgi:hypothetical protein
VVSFLVVFRSARQTPASSPAVMNKVFRGFAQISGYYLEIGHYRLLLIVFPPHSILFCSSNNIVMNQRG